MRRSIALLALILLPSCRVNMPWQPATEVQVYPAGVIAGIQARTPLGQGATFFVRGAYNDTDRRDFGEHDEEEGGGPGIGIGFRRDYLPAAAETWFFGARLDLWQLEIDWREDDGASGTTDILVLQPAGEVGYRVRRSRGAVIEFAASLGAEVNVDTDGEDVGEGAILLLGVTFVL